MAVTLNNILPIKNTVKEIKVLKKFQNVIGMVCFRLYALLTI